MYVKLGITLMVAWVLGLIVFHATGGLIHMLLIAAILMIVWSVVAESTASRAQSSQP